MNDFFVFFWIKKIKMMDEKEGNICKDTMIWSNKREEAERGREVKEEGERWRRREVKSSRKKGGAVSK